MKLIHITTPVRIICQATRSDLIMDPDKTSTILRSELCTEYLDQRFINLWIAMTELRKKPRALHAPAPHSHTLSAPFVLSTFFHTLCRVYLLYTPSLRLASLATTSCSFYVVSLFAARGFPGLQLAPLERPIQTLSLRLVHPASCHRGPSAPKAQEHRALSNPPLNRQI